MTKSVITRYNSIYEGMIVVLADAVDDLEKARIAANNRARAMRDAKEMPEAAVRQKALADALEQLEHEAVLDLNRVMRKHPLGDFVKRTPGIGEKSIARLLACIGDPALRPNPAKLHAYCGYHTVDGKRPKRRRGLVANWNGKAKTRAFICAEAAIKVSGKGRARSPYRDIYDRERQKWLDRDTTDLHKHNHALSIVAKQILTDLWKEARKTQGLAYNKNRT